MTIESHWPLEDRRSAEQLANDQRDVRRQVEVLRTAQHDIVERIRARRRTVGRPIVSYAPDGGDRRILLAENQLVVDTARAADGPVREVLDRYRGEQEHEGPGWRRRTRVFTSRDPRRLDLLRADADTLRRHGIPAGVNVIVPLGYVIKGNSYPGVSTAPGPFATNGATAPVRVAIVDTGLTDQPRTDDWMHEVRNEGTDPLDEVAPSTRIDWFGGHGTFAAGIVRQIAPDCEVWVYRFTGPDGLGSDEAAADMLVRAADDAAGHRLIINASFGAPAVDGIPPLAMKEAVDHIHDTYENALIVASAGNDGLDVEHYPAAFPGVKAVGALNSDLTPAAFSNHGSWLDCSAVGVGIVSTFVKGLLPPELDLSPTIEFGPDSWATWSGTSFTAPQISAAVAALCGEDAGLSPRQAFEQLVAGRPDRPDYGKVVHLLPGTPL
ncbi:S8/S53 family peptidase [Actinoplanes sp. NPDC049548]|uniref:S8 family peptidase n=1 Tax=Actinoplanes sp. NPDC049548 TaxID=3155152 RepID=UPI003420DA0C